VIIIGGVREPKSANYVRLCKELEKGCLKRMPEEFPHRGLPLPFIAQGRGEYSYQVRPTKFMSHPTLMVVLLTSVRCSIEVSDVL
jgi:hypothetical protein